MENNIPLPEKTKVCGGDLCMDLRNYLHRRPLPEMLKGGFVQQTTFFPEFP